MKLAATKPTGKFEQVVRRQWTMPVNHLEKRKIALGKRDRFVFGAPFEAKPPATDIGSHERLVAQRTALVTVRYEQWRSAIGVYAAVYVVAIFYHSLEGSVPTSFGYGRSTGLAFEVVVLRPRPPTNSAFVVA